MQKTSCKDGALFRKAELFGEALRLKGMMCAVWQMCICLILHLLWIQKRTEKNYSCKKFDIIVVTKYIVNQNREVSSSFYTAIK